MPHHALWDIQILTEITEFDLLPIWTDIDREEETTHTQTGHDVLESAPGFVRHRWISVHPIEVGRVDRSLRPQLMAQRRRQNFAFQQHHPIQQVALARSQFGE